jgi:hypothetical protein
VGFEADPDVGCRAILPAEPCEPGTMALPGETSCHSLGDCGDGTWGDIPVDGDTEYVDVSYLGGDSDGSAARPWTRINSAVAHAPDGGLIAIAAGTYHEAVTNSSKGARLWGRCAEMVAIDGGVFDGVYVLGQAGPTELVGLSVRGDNSGISVTCGDLLIDRVRVHDSARGLQIGSIECPVAVEIRDSLIESSLGIGVLLGGVTGTMERTVIRDTLPRQDATGGRGLVLQASPDDTPANVTVRQSVVEGARHAGITVIAASATFEDLLVRRTLPQASDQRGGRGIEVSVDWQMGTGLGASATLRRTVVTDVRDVGIAVFGADVALESTIVHHVLPNELYPERGAGITVQRDKTTDETSSAQIRSSFVTDVRWLGILASDSEVELEAVRVRASDEHVADGYGAGGIYTVGTQGWTSVARLRGVAIERTAEAGVMAHASQLVAERLLVADTRVARDSGLYGDGVLVVSSPTAGTAEAEITLSRIAGSSRAGLSTFGAQVGLGLTELECNTIDLDGELADERPFSLDSLGPNLCHCQGEVVECRVLSSSLTAPEPVDPIEPLE